MMPINDMKQRWHTWYQEKQRQLSDWWAPLSQREKLSAGVGAAALSIFLVYVLLYLPLVHQTTQLRKAIKTNTNLLAWMQVADKKITQEVNIKGEVTIIQSPVALLSVLQTETDKVGLSGGLTELKQAGSDSVIMQFKKIEFDKLMQLLIHVLKANAVKVEKLSAVQQDAPGIVNAEVVFRL